VRTVHRVPARGDAAVRAGPVPAADGVFPPVAGPAADVPVAGAEHPAAQASVSRASAAEPASAFRVPTGSSRE
jgi:hypothetical protein